MRLGIIGGGTVGRATARTYLEWVDEVRVFDLKHECRTHDLMTTLDTDLIFLCLPEASLEKFLQACDHLGKHWVIKSTVPIGFTARMAKKFSIDVVHSPEFLTERCAFVDAQTPTRNIVGYPNQIISSKTGERLRNLLLTRFPGVAYLSMTSDESEAVKLFQNAFFATKVSFFNELYCLARELDLNWDYVLAGILADGRIAHSHTKVPGPDGQFGFGGKCLPKDLQTLLEGFRANSVLAPILCAVSRRNTWDRPTGSKNATID